MKTAADENFPVGSRLIARPLRPHIAAFYAFARGADDIADDPSLSADQKLLRLDAFEAGLDGMTGDGIPRAAIRVRQSLEEMGVASDHCRHLLQAFRLDACKARYADWSELMAYCMLSAAPVGRYLMDLHGEATVARPAADALCAALQVLNHLQDCRRDFLDLDRIYLPQDALRRHGARERDLAGDASTSELRAVLDETLAKTERLIGDGQALPAALSSRRLAMESATILRLADRLATRLARADPLANRVALSKWDFLAAGCGGILAIMTRRNIGGMAGRPASRQRMT
jgi:hydroxysqualene synthase